MDPNTHQNVYHVAKTEGAQRAIEQILPDHDAGP